MRDMQTVCVRCHKTIDSVQGYKFSPTEYVCMSCYDEFKAERAAKAKKQRKNPLLDRYGAERTAPAASTAPTPPPPAPPTVETAPQRPAQPAPQPPSESGMFAPKTSPRPVPAAPAAPRSAPGADICDVCQKPIPDFKVPLKGGKKVCMGCNDILRDVAKSIALNVKCPHCGQDFHLTED
jgi:DNA-directed RNA polymerase subunit RPC12/RpoP